MPTVRAMVTIDDAFEAFLAEQRERLPARTLRNYEDVVHLLRDSLNGYAYDSLGKSEQMRWRAAFDGGDEEAYCHLFGPEKIVDHLGEFLGWFMVRKVMAGEDLLRASGDGDEEAGRLAARARLHHGRAAHERDRSRR